MPLTLDGVSLMTGTAAYSIFHQLREVHFFQPKKPPIPEDAVVLADYMLMADFVAQTSAGIGTISKGVRHCSVSRDIFYEAPYAKRAVLSQEIADYGGFKIQLTQDAADNTSVTQRLPSFSTNWVVRGENVSQYALYNGSSASAGDTGSGNSTGNFKHLTASLTLGLHNSGWNVNAHQNPVMNAIEIATPTHTSSHYQTFETPFLHELVGGDRNMEQTNLVVTPDGKTWDEVTRDTSYLGKLTFRANKNTSNQANQNPIILDLFRGTRGAAQFEEYLNKDFAIAYDRYICLRQGQYEVRYWAYVNSNTAAGDHRIYVNGQIRVSNYTSSLDTNVIMCTTVLFLKRGDYIQFQGSIVTSMGMFEISKA